MEHVVTLWLGNICQDNNNIKTVWQTMPVFLLSMDRKYTVWQYFECSTITLVKVYITHSKIWPYDWVDMKSGLTNSVLADKATEQI